MCDDEKILPPGAQNGPSTPQLTNTWLEKCYEADSAMYYTIVYAIAKSTCALNDLERYCELQQVRNSWNSSLSSNRYQRYPYVILFYTATICKSIHNIQEPQKTNEHNIFLYKKSKPHYCRLPAGSLRLIFVYKLPQYNLLRVSAALVNAIHHFKWDHYGNVFQTQHYDATVTAVAILSTSAPAQQRILLSVSSYILPSTASPSQFCLLAATRIYNT